MLAFVGILVLAASVALFQWTLKRGRYRRYPIEQFALVGASAAIGLTTVVGQPNAVHWLLFVIELLALVALTLDMGIGARFSRGEVNVKVGDVFPRLQLPDSGGGRFDSDSLKGRDGKTALYLFYRGPW